MRSVPATEHTHRFLAMIDPETLEQMRARGGTWASYQNHDASSRLYGHRQFLQVGPGCTHAVPPEHMPDTSLGFGWRYLFEGLVDLVAGVVHPSDREDAVRVLSSLGLAQQKAG